MPQLCRRFFHAGPAVGQGGASLGQQPLGQDLDPVTWQTGEMIISQTLFSCESFGLPLLRQVWLDQIKAANVLQMQAEQLTGSVLDRYKVKRRKHFEYQAAARLWAKGLSWTDASQIVGDAFEAVLEDTT